MKFLTDDDDLDPITTAVNLVDVFLVIIAALIISIAQNPLNPFSSENVTVIKNEGEPNMEIIVKEGNEIKQFKSNGDIGSGNGQKAGTAYQMKDGSMVYVPQNKDGKGSNND
ncbi:DUF2149 domain-containing protein [Pseudomonas sp. HK3]